MYDTDQIVNRAAKGIFNDSYLPALRLQYVDIGKDASSPTSYCRLIADADGSGGSKLIIFLNIGASATDYHQYQFDAYATATTDPDGVASGTGITHTQCTTMKALINALNAVDGIKCHRLHTPADRSIDTDDFLDITTTALGPLWLDTLYADASEVTTYAMRVGIPENINGKIGRGRLGLVRMDSIITHTSGIVTIISDPNETDESEEVILMQFAAGTTATLTNNLDYTKEPIVFKGPILIEVTGTLTASTSANWINLVYRSEEH